MEVIITTTICFDPWGHLQVELRNIFCRIVFHFCIRNPLCITSELRRMEHNYVLRVINNYSWIITEIHILRCTVSKTTKSINRYLSIEPNKFHLVLSTQNQNISLALKNNDLVAIQKTCLQLTFSCSVIRFILLQTESFLIHL